MSQGSTIQQVEIVDDIDGPVAIKSSGVPASTADKALTVTQSPNRATAAVAFGEVTGVMNVLSAIRKTTYVEQTANFTGSISSTNVNDTAAGTGARSVTITYYDQTGAGPFTETANLNGLLAVNLVNANHCFIEKIVVNSVGALGSNQGIITLFTGAGGAGVTVGSIAASDNTTMWAHHYVPTGKTCTIGDLSAGTTGNQNGEVHLRFAQPTVANAPEVKVVGSVVAGMNSSSSHRRYDGFVDAPKFSGFGRITAYVVPVGNGTTFFGDFSYSEQ
jgi:hypothetical protein